jgi:hypothetical protein
MNNLWFNCLHVFDLLIAIPILMVLLPIMGICLYITKNDIKYPEQRKVVIEKAKQLYPKSLFSAWKEGFR